MTPETTDKIRKIIIDLYECEDIFTPASPLSGIILDGDFQLATVLAIDLEDEFKIDLGNAHEEWQTVQDVFDSVEAKINE